MRFRVAIEGLPESGATEVIFPEARLPAGPQRSRRVRYGTLTLRRGVTRSQEWYEWWDHARTAKTPRKRTVTVVLIDERGADVHQWTFDNARPSGYLLSNLNALGNEPLIETLELAIGGFAASFGSQAAKRRMRT
ncbi:MAG: phage tail protein [Rhodoplanes sp.]